MKKFCFIFALAIIAALVFAAMPTKPVEARLWPDGAPEDNGLSALKEEKHGVVVTNVSDPVLYIYPAGRPNGTAVVMCPGGAYSGLAMDHEGHDMAAWFNSLGVTYAVLKYRMPAGHAAIPLDDAEQAMRLMHSRAAEFGVDTTKIGIMGASAGGHLASTLATHYSSVQTRPAFQILLYPVISMDDSITHRGSRDNLLGADAPLETAWRYSNELHVSGSTPKAFIAVSADDSDVSPENSLRYLEALTNNGVSSSLHVYPSGGHGWGFLDHFDYKTAWTGELECWLRNEIF